MKKTSLLLYAFLIGLFLSWPVSATADYKDEPTYIALRDSMRHAFNDADSLRFFAAVTTLEDYLLQQDDLHAYYTQRCNEIVFLMNTHQIYEAYKKSQKLSHELRERQLDKEMYMSVNMMGHIYSRCGNKEAAIACFWDVIRRMEDAGYRESMPPIYMNIVNVLADDNPQEALQLINEAIDVASEVAPERVFDIETRRTLLYYSIMDYERFREGYIAYRQGVERGLSSVHGRSIEVYYLAFQGRTEEAIQKAISELGENSYDTQADIYSRAGMWEEAYEASKKASKEQETINSVILGNSIQGMEDELRIYEAERRATANRTLFLIVIISLLALLVVALVYIIWSRRRHIRQLQRAYQHALESDNLKTAFIQNVSHEIRTPLNIISGFAQVLASPDMETSQKQRQNMAQMMTHNTHLITTLVDEMLELSANESATSVNRNDNVKVGSLMQSVISENMSEKSPDAELLADSSALPADFELVTSDRMLRRMLNALVSNAVKNTEHGTIVLKAHTTTDAVVFTVEDTGIGIPHDKAEQVFERFVKLDEFKPGIGLGLTLCRTLAERLGGSVSLDTNYHPGARFVLTLPV